MIRLKNLRRFHLRTLLLVVTAFCVYLWWFETRPREFVRRQSSAGNKQIHDRDRLYFDSVYDPLVRDHLVTVIGDSRLTHWNNVLWIVCPDSNVIISYGADRALLMWNRNDGSIRRGFYNIVTSSYAPIADRFFMVEPGGKLLSWSRDEPPAIEPISLPKSDYGSLVSSRCGKFFVYIAQTSHDAAVTLWNREAGKRVGGVYEQPNAAVYSPDSTTVLLADVHAISEYDAAAGTLRSRVPIPALEAGGFARISTMVFSQSGEDLYVGDASGRVLLFAWKEKRFEREWKSCPSSIQSIDVSGQEPSLLISSNGNLVREFLAAPPSLPKRNEVLLNEQVSAACNAATDVVAGIRNGRLVDMMGGVSPRRMVGGPRVDATCFAFSPRGDRIALAGRDGQIVVRATSDWRRVQSWRAHDAWIRRLVWSPRGDLLLSLGDDHTLAAWNPGTGDELRTWGGWTAFHQRMVTFDERGEYFAGFFADGGFDISIVRADTFETVRSIPNTSLSVRGNFLLSRDASRLYAGGDQVRFNVWNIDAESLVTSAGTPTGDEVKLALNRAESVVFFADWKTVSAHEAATGKLLWTVPVHESLISDISLHPSRPILASCGNDGTVALVDTESGTLLRRLRLGPARGDIVQVDFSPDGQLFAVAMNNGAVVVMRSPWD